MTAIAIELPEQVQVASDGIVAFAEQEVMPRHAKLADLFEDPTRLYDSTGRFSNELIAVITEVRMASAQAGFSQCAYPKPSVAPASATLPTTLPGRRSFTAVARRTGLCCMR